MTAGFFSAGSCFFRLHAFLGGQWCRLSGAGIRSGWAFAAAIVLSACMSPGSGSSLTRDAADIDQLYLATAQALAQPDRAQSGVVRSLTEQMDDLAIEDGGRDPCLEQKRRQLMPILLTLAVINGLHDPQEQAALRGEALQHLRTLGTSQAASADGDLCFGRGFPAIMLGKP